MWRYAELAARIFWRYNPTMTLEDITREGGTYRVLSTVLTILLLEFVGFGGALGHGAPHLYSDALPPSRTSRGRTSFPTCSTQRSTALGSRASET